jgi:hypothetical protein
MGYAISSFQNHFITVWRRPATMEALRAVREAEMQLIKASPNGISVITVMEPSSFEKPLGATERAEAAAIARDCEASTLAAAYVFEGEGFRAAMARAVVSGIMLLTRAKHPNKVFSNIPAGLEWLGPQLGPVLGRFDGRSLQKCIEEAREGIWDSPSRPIKTM